MRFRHVLAVATVALVFATSILAQEQGQRGQRGQGQRGQGGQGRGGFQFGGGGGFGGFGGTSRLGLLRIEAVQKELELVDEQLTAINKVREELPPQRGFGGRGRGGEGGEGGRGRRGGGDNPGGNRNPPPQGASLSTPTDWFFVQQEAQPPQRGERGQRGGGFQITEEQRAEFERQRLERLKLEKDKLAEILLPHQMKRLNEIYYQQLGDRVVDDPDVVAALKITDEQKTKLASVREENNTARQAMMREMFQNRPEGARGEGGRGRGGFGLTEEQQAKMDEARKKDTEKLMAVLTDAQRKQLDELKGKPFEMPENAFGRGRGGPGGAGGAPGGRGRGGDNPRPNPNP